RRREGRDVLNASRRPRNPHRAVDFRHEHLALCSTPRGVHEILTGASLSSRWFASCAQRLAASTKSSPTSLTIRLSLQSRAQRLAASTKSSPFIVVDTCPILDVLNASRRPRNPHAIQRQPEQLTDFVLNAS